MNWAPRQPAQSRRSPLSIWMTVTLICWMLNRIPAGLKIERTSFLEDGRVVEFTRSIYRSDAYDFVAELRLLDTKDT